MKTHWRKLDNPNYLGAYSLMDGQTKEIVATIKKVVVEDVKSERGSEPCKVAYLNGLKPMILNTVNCKAIEKAYDTPFIDDWAGKEITIYVARVKAFGDTVDALRIKPEPPKGKPLPELTPKDPKWKAVVDALIAGQITIEQLKQKKFRLSEVNENKLKEALQQ